MQLYNFETDETTHKPNGEIQYEVVKNDTNEKVLDFSEDLTGLTGGAAQMVLREASAPAKLRARRLYAED